ncbi:MAG: cupin [Gammaproteobacteria bacterium]|nr:cupin [Gammaproteobacteria bacterium]
MPTKQCRFVRPGVTQTSEFFHTPKVPDGRSIGEVFERIEQPGAWVALYNIQTEPEYRRLIDELIDSVRPVVEREQPGIFNPAGYFFISAPPSVTPFHLDSENNFWLQARGRKRMTVFDRCDRELVPASAVEEFIIHRSLDGVRLDPALRHHGRDFDVGPGDGVYFPSTSPHMTSTTAEWARPGDGVSVSLAITFYTAVTRQHARVHQCNRVLRRLGVEPRFPGQSRWRDAVKAPLGRLITAALVKFRNYVVPPGGA